ncbi:SDR family oxidoreductase [Gynuella sunshinyii]|uniref:Putative nucleoside-diphosphate-sugar epimerase n=1 Tax=Gynuella sunshinyii YC6258 TaxID=1445510 RepID=A0A0C5VGG3_9GAMM|nr:SDR family oxidoreductase [Gynuella sunshinyii]AJQ93256.1 putative nucleoside-diphosphate-sugar epimerase [Gynuella sunshinyii YC6258]
MKRVLLAGASGYLGRAMLAELKTRGYWVRVLVRTEQQQQALSQIADDTFLGQATDIDTLSGLMDGIDLVFTSIGITRQKDGLTYESVDYGANLNLLTLAENSKVEKFIYVSVFNADKLPGIKIIQAKEKFVARLKSSWLPYCVIRPSGFFADMKEFLVMAKSGRVYLLGNGQLRFNPISGADLAKVCCDMFQSEQTEVDVGGPEVYSHDQIAELAFKALGEPVKMTHFPLWLVGALVSVMRWLSPVSVYGPVEFFAKAMSVDMQAPCYGEESLESFFVHLANIDNRAS